MDSATTSTTCQVTQDLGSSVTEVTDDDVVVSMLAASNAASTTEAVEISSSVTTTPASITTTTTSGSQLPGKKLLVIARTLSRLYCLVKFSSEPKVC